MPIKYHNVCLNEIMKLRFGDLSECQECGESNKLHSVRNRCCYECQWCGFQIYLAKGTDRVT